MAFSTIEMSSAPNPNPHSIAVVWPLLAQTSLAPLITLSAASPVNAGRWFLTSIRAVSSIGPAGILLPFSLIYSPPAGSTVFSSICKSFISAWFIEPPCPEECTIRTGLSIDTLSNSSAVGCRSSFIFSGAYPIPTIQPSPGTWAICDCMRWMISGISLTPVNDWSIRFFPK